MKDKLLTTVYITIMVVVVGALAYQIIAFYDYPCEAFKSGWLSLGYAPARCIQ